MNAQLKQAIINDLGLGALSLAEQDTAIERVGKLIFQSVLLRVSETLNETDQKALEKLLGEPASDPSTLFTFLGEKAPNLNELVKEEVFRFKEEQRVVMEGLAAKAPRA